MQELAGEDAIQGNEQTATEARPQIENLLRASEELAEELAARPNLGLNTAPRRELERFAELGLLTAPLPAEFGGLGLGTDPGNHTSLLRLLAIVGGADLALGRIYEGHVNGILLVARYGSREQLGRLADDCRAGRLSAVWNTGAAEPMRVRTHEDGFRLEGIKTFATGAAFIERPIVTAELVTPENAGRGWQMTIPRMEMTAPALDRSFWHPLGMEARPRAYGVDFTGCGHHRARTLIGNPGDFYRDPDLPRRCHPLCGRADRGHPAPAQRCLPQWLEDKNRRAEDPYQLARLGGGLDRSRRRPCCGSSKRRSRWLNTSFYAEREGTTIQRMVECANMTRTADPERLAAQRHGAKVTVGVGAHGLLQPQRFERVLRDLTMYLRQPAPDCDVERGRPRPRSIKAHKRSEGVAVAASGPAAPSVESLPPRYFERIYERQNGDPWEFRSQQLRTWQVRHRTIASAAPRNAIARRAGDRLLDRRAYPAASPSARTQLLGLDVSDRALEQCARTLQRRTSTNVRVRTCMQVPV